MSVPITCRYYFRFHVNIKLLCASEQLLKKVREAIDAIVSSHSKNRCFEIDFYFNNKYVDVLNLRIVLMLFSTTGASAVLLCIFWIYNIGLLYLPGD